MYALIILTRALSAQLPYRNAIHIFLLARVAELRDTLESSVNLVTICPETNENIIEKPEIDGLGASIDGAVLANCTQQYVVLVDETMNFITFQLESEYRVNPRLTLQGEDDVLHNSNV
uniref:Irg-7 N-terminal galactose binding domain-containing protein n=1 Tax=Heterorhabditis bacteriophora TaxID=37862 RepID=A0A1I7XUF6_HETBA